MKKVLAIVLALTMSLSTVVVLETNVQVEQVQDTQEIKPLFGLPFVVRG